MSRFLDYLFAVGFFIAGVGGLYFAYKDFSESSALEENGIEVFSQPLEEYVEHTKNGTVVSYTIKASFATASGSIHQCHGRISSEMLEQLKGMPIVRVRYLADTPKICTVVGSDKDSLWMTILSILLSLIAIAGSVAYIYFMHKKDDDEERIVLLE